MIETIGKLKMVLNCKNTKLCPICKGWIEALIEDLEADEK